jgi:hypothetical protein
MALVPQSASAQGLWVGGWGWGGPVAMGGFGPAFYGPSPFYSPAFSAASWGYPVYRSAYYGPAYYGPSYYRPAYAPIYRAGPVYAGPTAHAVRVGNRVARRNWRRGFGWGW